MIILAELFKLTLDELVLEEVKKQENKPTIFESETAYDIDTQKHFDINLGSARTVTLKTGSDEKIHIRLSSDALPEIGSAFKVKLDENKGRLDVELENKKGASRFEIQERVDITILLPEKFTEHAEVSASVRELYIEDLRMKRLEYDGDAQKVYIRDVDGSVELTAKTDYEIWLSGGCPKLDVNQFKAKTVVHLKDAENYRILNKGRKCSLITRQGGEMVEIPQNETAENTISTSGLFSELIVEIEG
jgi:hypothetical protein